MTTAGVAPIVAAICLLGCYAESGEVFAVYTAIFFGVVLVFSAATIIDGFAAP